jgi:hypothetical protein
MIRGAVVAGKPSWPAPLLRVAAVVALACSAALAACSSASPSSSSVSVKPSAFKAAARPRDCQVEFLQKPPARAYDALGELYGYWPTVVKPADVLREKACEMGADAVIVTRDFLISTVAGPDRKEISGTAIKYREAAPAAPAAGGGS